ncbi:hypothetical protein NO1_1359 [Candidatus Termititenax aidoneus]|uniref:Uncharacterized protein n=1 Tax=Termititenax aidoneus TaxID=2218524 RepID=A0A388TBJ6_TERA1|nr:hypothetical protein NO1_1359 [Candidatus Termititenax aidoneus]
MSCSAAARPYAALVNGETIPLAEFETALASAKTTLIDQNSIDLESEEGKFILATTQRSIIDDMINQTLVRQQAVKMNIVVTSADVQEEIARLRAGFPSQKLFEETLAQEHINSAELLDGVRSRLVAEKIKKTLAKKTDVSDKELNGFLESNQELFTDQSESSEAKKYLLRKKENEIYDRWFAKVRGAAKIEINPDILSSDEPALDPGQKPLPDKTISNGRV